MHFALLVACSCAAVVPPFHTTTIGDSHDCSITAQYNFFFRDERAQILAEREEQAKTTGKEPDKTDFFSILGKTIAARWKSKTEEDRQKYKEMAAKDMKRYRAEMELYHESIANS